MTGQIPIGVRFEIEGLYARYARLIDEGPLTEWPQLFTQEAIYKIVTGENVVQSWPLALVLCEGRAAIEDRVKAISELMLTIPRRMRHLISGLSVAALAPNKWTASASFAVFESLPGKPTQLFATGLYRDVLDGSESELLFEEKLVICDGELIRNSLVLPL